MTVVHRPGHHDSRPDGKAIGPEGPYIGAHYTNNSGCKGAAMTETYVNIWTGDYHLNCSCCKEQVKGY
jgi:hypothetical protein